MVQRLSAAISILLMSVLSLTAQEKSSVSVMGMYGWNETWQSHGGADISGVFPVRRHFEALGAAEYLSPGVFSVAGTARPKFPLKTGEIFIDGTVHYRNYSNYGIGDLNLAASAGYRMDYVSVQVGITSHFSIDTERTSGSASENITEPVNLLYKVYFNVRPASCAWNAGAGLANYTDYEYERTWQPMYFAHAHYDISNRLSILLRADLKPAGAFHLNAEFWGVDIRTGIRYTFGYER